MIFWWQKYPTLEAARGARSVRELGRQLVFARRALTAMAPATAPVREVIAEDIVNTVMAAIRDHLTHQSPLRDNGQRQLLARLRDRVELIANNVTSVSDVRFEACLLLATIAQLNDDDATAKCHLVWAMDRVSLIRSADLRERVLNQALGISLASGEIRPSALGLLNHIFGRRQPGPMQPESLNILMLVAPRAAFFAAAGLPHMGRVLRRWSALANRPPRLLMSRIAALLLQRLMPRALAKDLLLLPQPSGPPRVVRAMGGVGDLLMMTPGLRALASRAGQPVEFVAPARFQPLLAGNSSITFRAAEDLDDAWWRAGPIIDLTDCPAAAVESRTAPHIRRDRTEIFAQAMGVTEPELLASGDRPVFDPLPEDRLTAHKWLQAHGLSPQSFIVVQVKSAESYRDYPNMPDLSARLARIAPVVVVHDRPLQGYLAPGLHTAFDLPLGAAFALGCEARLIVAPDSSFVHLAAARDIPVVAIFGPIDGEVRTRRHPRARVVSQAGGMACVPCWRNEHMVCKASNTRRSVCMHTLPVERVVDAVREELARIPG